MRLICQRSIVTAAAILLGLAVNAHALTFTVDSTGTASDAAPGNGVCATSGGVCTLAAAIQEANATAALDTIAFAIGSGLQRITSGTLTVTKPVVIDGWTQPGFSGTPLIEIRGSGGKNSGLVITTSGATVRGLVINGFGGEGIQVTGGGNHVFEGNYVGMDANGDVAIPNDGSGIRFSNSSNNRIGGTVAGQGNLISGNTPKGNGGGIEIDGGTGNIIKGNFIGSDITGMEDWGNDGRGIALAGALNTVVGGPEPGAGNLIAGNWATGVRVLGGSNNALVQGNTIGLNRDWTAFLANDRGVQIRGSHDAQVIGNVIGGNVYDGVIIWSGSNNNRVFTETGSCTTGTATVTRRKPRSTASSSWTAPATTSIGNRIWGNLQLGIRLDPAAAATAPAPPVVTSAVVSGASTTIKGTVTGTAGVEYVVDLHINVVCDYDGAGEGEFNLGQVRTTIGANGQGTFTSVIGMAFQAGRLVTATATRSGGNTSQFSQCKAVQ